MKTEKIFMPYYMIETGEARRTFPTYVTEHSVFYVYAADWVFHYHDSWTWAGILRARRN